MSTRRNSPGPVTLLLVAGLAAAAAMLLIPIIEGDADPGSRLIPLGHGPGPTPFRNPDGIYRGLPRDFPTIGDHR